MGMWQFWIRASMYYVLIYLYVSLIIMYFYYHGKWVWKFYTEIYIYRQQIMYLTHEILTYMSGEINIKFIRLVCLHVHTAQTFWFSYIRITRTLLVIETVPILLCCASRYSREFCNHGDCAYTALTIAIIIVVQVSPQQNILHSCKNNE